MLVLLMQHEPWYSLQIYASDDDDAVKRCGDSMTVGDLRSLGYAAIPQRAGKDDKPKLQVPKKFEMLSFAQKKFVTDKPLRTAMHGQKNSLLSAHQKTDLWFAFDKNLPPRPQEQQLKKDTFEGANRTYAQVQCLLTYKYSTL